MSELIPRNKQYLIKSQYGSYNINNRKTAEQLNTVLTDYETIRKQHQRTEAKLDRIQKQIINLQMTIKILGSEIDKLMEETQ